MSCKAQGVVLGACDHCSRIKQRCNGENPCSRCHRLFIDCQRYGKSKDLRSPIVQNTRSDHDVKATHSATSRRAAVIKRVRTGCTSCKTRRKKCDEVVPKCGDCKRLNLSCHRFGESTSPSPPPQIQHSHSPPSSFTSYPSEEIIYTAAPSDTFETSPIFSGSFSPLPNVSAQHDYFAEYISTTPEPPGAEAEEEQESTILQCRPSQSISFQRPFSTTLFELTHKQDQHLLRHFIRVVSRSLSIIHEDEANPFISLLVPLAGTSAVVMESLLALSASHLRRVYPQILETGLAHQSKALNSLKTLISNPNPTPTPTPTPTNTNPTSTTETKVKSNTKSKTETETETLATILLLCLLEISDGNSNSKNWTWHILAARTIILSRPKTQHPSTTTWKFLLAIFGYVDTVITISKCQAPLITLEELDETTNHNHHHHHHNNSSSSSSSSSSNNKTKNWVRERRTSGSEEEVGDAESMRTTKSSAVPYIAHAHTHTHTNTHTEALFGIAQPLFNIIGKISSLANRRKDRMKDSISDLQFRQTALDIERELQEWEPPPPSPSSPPYYSPSTTTTQRTRNNQDIHNAAYAIKWASILRLHQVVEGYQLSHPKVRESTLNILSHISRIRFGSSVESILVFPLVMAGAGCRDDEERMFVRERWMVMERTIGFENVGRAREMVEAVWRKVDEGRKNGQEDGGERVNWAKIRYYDFPGVVLL